MSGKTTIFFTLLLFLLGCGSGAEGPTSADLLNDPALQPNTVEEGPVRAPDSTFPVEFRFGERYAFIEIAGYYVLAIGVSATDAGEVLSCSEIEDLFLGLLFSRLTDSNRNTFYAEFVKIDGSEAIDCHADFYFSKNGMHGHMTPGAALVEVGSEAPDSGEIILDEVIIEVKLSTNPFG